MTSTHPFRKAAILATVAVLMLLMAGLSAARLLAQQEQGSIPGLTLTSDTPGELVVSWDAPDPAPSDYRISWASADQGYLSWKDENEDHGATPIRTVRRGHTQ